MNREEMIQRLKNGEDPVEVAATKWDDIGKLGFNADQATANCALCYTYQDNCSECTFNKVGGKSCIRVEEYRKYTASKSTRQEKYWARKFAAYIRTLKAPSVTTCAHSGEACKEEKQ